MSRRALLISLIVSVAVNLFVIGAVVGALAIGSRMHQGRPGGFRAAGPLWGAAEGLSPERQDAYRAALRGEAGVVGGKLRAARQARREAWLSLNEEHFDPKVAVVALDRARALEFEARGDVERRIVNFAATLTPAERARLAEGLARAGPGPRHRDRPPPGPEGPPPKE